MRDVEIFVLTNTKVSFFSLQKKECTHLKLSTINRKATCPISIDKVSTLNHERMNDPVKQAIFVTLRDAMNAMRADTECAEIGDRSETSGERVRGEFETVGSVDEIDRKFAEQAGGT